MSLTYTFMVSLSCSMFTYSYVFLERGSKLWADSKVRKNFYFEGSFYYEWMFRSYSYSYSDSYFC